MHILNAALRHTALSVMKQPFKSFSMNLRNPIALSALLCSGILLGLLLFPSCKMTATFKDSSVLPNARGTADATHTKDDHFALVVRVEHLAGPEFLTPPKKVYVVWVETKRRGTTNVGVLTIDSNKTGTLSTTMAYKPLNVFITAENSAQAFLPEGQIVLRSTTL